MTAFRLFYDGSCWPNPGGVAGYGYAVFKEGQVEPVDTGSGVINAGFTATNNLAEFHALHRSLAAFWNHALPAKGDKLSVYGDSNLVTQIMNRHWRPRPDKPYYPDYEVAATWVKDLRKYGVIISFDWIPRAQNQVCDDLSKAHNK